MHAPKRAIPEPDRYAFDVNVDSFRGLVAMHPDDSLTAHKARRAEAVAARSTPYCALARLGRRLPLPYEVTVLDGVFVGDGYRGTTPAALGAKRFADRLRFVAFDVPVLAGVDPRGLSWAERRSRLELLAEAFELPIQLSPIAERCVGRAPHMTAGPIAGRVIRDRTSTYRDGSRSGWFNVKDRSRYEREAWRSEQR